MELLLKCFEQRSDRKIRLCFTEKLWDHHIHWHKSSLHLIWGGVKGWIKILKNQHCMIHFNVLKIEGPILKKHCDATGISFYKYALWGGNDLTKQRGGAIFLICFTEILLKPFVSVCPYMINENVMNNNNIRSDNTKCVFPSPARTSPALCDRSVGSESAWPGSPSALQSCLPRCRPWLLLQPLQLLTRRLSPARPRPLPAACCPVASAEDLEAPPLGHHGYWAL